MQFSQTALELIWLAGCFISGCFFLCGVSLISSLQVSNMFFFPSFSHQEDFLRFMLKLASLLPMLCEGEVEVSWETL